MASNIYSTKFELDAKGFIQQTGKAGETYAKFTGNIITDSKKVIVGFDGFIKKFTLIGVSMKGITKLMEGYQKAMASTGMGQDSLSVQTAQLDAAIEGFSERLTNLGGLGNFNTSILESISLAAEFQKALNSFI